MLISCACVRPAAGAAVPGKVTKSTAPSAYAQKFIVPVSPGFGPREERAYEICPVVSATSAAIPADEPLGGVDAVVCEFHVLAGWMLSFGTVTLAGNGGTLSGGIWVILSWSVLNFLLATY